MPRTLYPTFADAMDAVIRQGRGVLVFVPVDDRSVHFAVDTSDEQIGMLGLGDGQSEPRIARGETR